MLQAVNRKGLGWFSPNSLKEFPCKDLGTIDQLWIQASNGHFGFSVQKELWEECGSPMSSGISWDRFCVSVGWKDSRSNNYLSYSNFKKNPALSSSGELPNLDRGLAGSWFWDLKVAGVLFSRAKACEL